ncbi:MAG TPA: hypothetical protein VFQ45_02745 [Longimicrobium sp.]|nr:hypothetical protein [Longimicrobium sp.]
MPNANASGPIKNGSLTNSKMRKEAAELIGQVDYAGIWRGAGTIAKSDTMRIDNQGKTSGGAANLQIQVGSGTIAHVQVSAACDGLSGGQADAVANTTRQALQDSVNSGNRYDVTC